MKLMEIYYVLYLGSLRHRGIRMFWLSLVSIKRHWTKYLLAIVGLAAAVAVTCFGLSGSALLWRMSKHPLLQTIGGDLMIYDKGIEFHGGPGRINADLSLFVPFEYTRISELVSESLPGSTTTGTLMVPVVTGLTHPMYAIRPLGGRENAGVDWIYRPHMIAGFEVENNGALHLMLAGATPERSPFGERVGQTRALVVPTARWEGDRVTYNLGQGVRLEFELIGLFGQPSNDLYWTGLSLLQRYAGLTGQVSFAGVALANPLALAEAKAILADALKERAPDLAVMSVDDFGEIMIADFAKMEQTAKFYTPVIILLCSQIIVVTSLAIARSRRRELALMRCLGLSIRQLQALFVVECLSVAVMGSAAGLAFYALMSRSMFRAYMLNLWPVWIALSVTVLVSILAARYAVKGELAADVLRNP